MVDARFYIHFALPEHFFLKNLNQFLKYTLYLQKVQSRSCGNVILNAGVESLP